MGTDEERFWAKVDKTGPCWEWLAATNNHGYGRFRFPWGHQLAHRFSYELANGPIPKGNGYHGTCVLHRCDNPGCVNPEHLWLGTHADNMADKDNKCRGPHGDRCFHAKLTWDDVENIRANSMNLTQRELGELFGVTQATVSDIVCNKTWKSEFASA
jgi:hypothetical protein